jgi:hypothetical protein
MQIDTCQPISAQHVKQLGMQCIASAFYHEDRGGVTQLNVLGLP